MSPKIRIALVGFVVLLVIIFLFAYFNQNKTPDVPVISSNAKAVVPVDPKGQGVTWAFAYYNFFGVIRELQPGNNGQQLTLYTPQNPDIPAFTITNTTRVFKTDQQKIAPAAVSDLKTGIKVAVIATYDLKTFKWTTRQIFIPVSSLPGTTPTTNRTVSPSPAR